MPGGSLIAGIHILAWASIQAINGMHLLERGAGIMCVPNQITSANLLPLGS